MGRKGVMPMDRAKLKSLLYEIGLSGGKRGELKDSGDIGRAHV